MRLFCPDLFSLDIDTADNMELVNSHSSSDCKYASLFSILNHCCTAIGKRQLRAVILKPFCSQIDLETRLDCVEELVQKTQLCLNLQVFILID